jgi:hypothetical protein
LGDLMLARATGGASWSINPDGLQP